MNLPNGSVDFYLVLRHATQGDIFRMLDRGVDLNGRYDTVGDTVYHVIIRNDHLQETDIIAISRIFRERGVNPASLNYHAKAPVHLAIEKRMRAVTDFFIKYNPMPDYSFTRFFVEDENKHFYPEIQSKLRNDDALYSENLEFKNADFLLWLIQNPYKGNFIDDELIVLNLAINYNLHHILPSLLLHIDKEGITNPECVSPLQMFLEKNAAMKKFLSESRTKNWYDSYVLRYMSKILQLFINKGVKFSASSIRLAIEEKLELNVIKSLVDCIPGDCDEADFSNILNGLIIFYNKTLDDSEVEGYLKILQDILTKGANINKADRSGMFPVEAAFKNKNVPVILWLLDVGADLTISTKDEQNLLHLLIDKKWENDVQETMLFHIIIGKGANVNKKDIQGTSPLHLAVKLFNKTLFKRLLKYGADVNCRDNKMRTPLHDALMDSQDDEFVKLLLENGANVNVRDVKGERPLFQAIRIGNKSIYLGTIQILSAPFRESPYCLKTLLQQGALVDTIVDSERIKKSQIFTMVKNMRQTTLRDLLQYGLDINNLYFQHFLPLHDIHVRLALAKHSVKLKAAELPFTKEYNDKFINNPYHKDSNEGILKEVEILKDVYIDNHTSLYDFFHMNYDKKCIYIHNEKLKELVDSPKLNEKFPNYADLILANYRKTVMRKSLLESAKETWMELTRIFLPDICIELILSFLTNTDLLDFIDIDYKSKAEMQIEESDSEDEELNEDINYGNEQVGPRFDNRFDPLFGLGDEEMNEPSDDDDEEDDFASDDEIMDY